MSVQGLIAQQRAAIIARDQALARNIDSAYSGMWQSLSHRLNTLLANLQTAEAAANASGQPFHALLWVKQIRGLDTLLGAVQLDVQSFAQLAQAYVAAQVRPSWDEGVQSALKLMGESLDNRIAFSFGRPSEQALDILLHRGASHEKIAEYFSELAPDAKDAVRKRLLAGLALGQNPREVARSIEQAVKMARNRAQVIARTELIGAYRDASLDTYRTNSDVVGQWQWSAADDRRTCAFCAAQDGQTFSLSTPFDSHPQCRCAAVPVTFSYADILARYAA